MEVALLRWIFLALAATLVVSQCWGPPSCRLFVSRGMGTGMFVVEVRGRLVDAASGSPLAGIGVLAVEAEYQATEKKTIAAFSWRSAAAKAAQAGGPAVDEDDAHGIYAGQQEHALTDAEGRFRVAVMVTHCIPYVGNEPVGSPYPSERVGLHGLMVEVPGGAPIVIAPLPPGSWQRSPEGPERRKLFDVWATWDLGDVPVPAAR